MALQAMLDTPSTRHLLQHASILWFSDSQAGTACLQRMAGHGRVLSEVRQIYLMAFQHDIEFLWQWLLRSHQLMQYAGYLSKQPDEAVFVMLSPQFSNICSTAMPNPAHAHDPQNRRQVSWGTPTLDVFGGSAADEHKARLFYSEFSLPGSAGVNAFLLGWNLKPAGAKYQLAWIYPPSHLVAAALRHLQQSICHAIVVLPAGRHSWSALLHTLPFVDHFPISWHPGLYRLGSRAPAQWKAAGQMPKRSLHVFRVWPGAVRATHPLDPRVVAPT